MNLFKTQTYANKELFDGWAIDHITADQYIKRELIISIFNDHQELLDGGKISYSFITFDWNSKSTPENEYYHQIIERCKFNQTRYYEICGIIK